MKLRKLSHPTPDAGYTLIEMLAVIVIIAVLAAIAAPGWVAYATRQRMTAVESDLVQVFKQAQETAISQRRTVEVQIDEAATIPTVNVTFGGNTNTQELGPNELRDGMITLEAAAGSDTISFDYQGAVRGQDANLPFVVNIEPSNGNQRQCVIVASLLGSVKTANNDADCDPDNLELEL